MTAAVDVMDFEGRYSHQPPLSIRQGFNKCAPLWAANLVTSAV
jgi:hypothetical protein